MSQGRRRRLGTEILLQVLRDRARLEALTDVEWNAFLVEADRARLLPRLAIESEQLRLSSAPDWARDRLAAAAVRGRQFEREIRWEIFSIKRALAPVGVDPVFLKGAAYVAAGLPCGVGRVVADIDILVPEAELWRAETALLGAGWQFGQLDAYDEKYYREWMHELPPLVHQERGTTLDVHHRILPRTGRRHPETSRLLSGSVDVGGARVLRLEHMVLHAAAHLLQDGEFDDPLRELVDIAVLAGLGLERDDFLDQLTHEAGALDLGRPLFYAIRYASRYLEGPFRAVPPERFNPWRPSVHTLRLMDRLVDSIVGKGGTASALAMYFRANWLKLPPHMFLRHSVSKAARFVSRPDRSPRN